MPLPIPRSWDMRGQHVRITTQDRELAGILLSIDNRWVYMESIMYEQDCSSGVRQNKIHTMPNAQTNCMIALHEVKRIEKIPNVGVL